MRRVSAVVVLAFFSAGCSDRERLDVYHAPKEDAPAESGPAMAAPGAAGLAWDTPKGWRKSTAPGGMRVASFAAGDPPADVSVVSLSGDAGGLLANVNRWRGQLGLAETDEAALASAARRLRSRAGEAVVVDMAGGGRRTVAAVLKAPPLTWFFKMTGEPAAVERERPAFEAWVRSARRG